MSPQDFDPQRTPYVQVTTQRGQFSFAILPHPEVRPGTVGLGKDHRAWIYVKAQGDFVDVDPLDVDRETGGKSYLQSATVEVRNTPLAHF